MNSKGLDVLAVGAHPDDVELNAGGTLLLAKALGFHCGICHMTDGEMGTRGTRAKRMEEATAAASLLGVEAPTFLGLPDGGLESNGDTKEAVIRTIRKHRPRIILAPYWQDLHPDHEATGQIVKHANFLSGLVKIDTGQEPWRASTVLYYMSHTPITASVVVDISDVFDQKKNAALCYGSQFFEEMSKEPQTFISGESFWDWWQGRASYWGHLVGVKYGEPFFIEGPIPLAHPFDLFRGFGKYKNP